MKLNNLTPIVLSAAALCAGSLSLSAATSGVVGAVSTTLVGGGSFNTISVPFETASQFQGPVDSVSGTTVTMGSDVSSVTLPAYVKILDGTASGVISEVSSVSGTDLVLADDLSASLAGGDTLAVKTLQTLDSIFGADNTYGFQASTDGSVGSADIISTFDPSTGVGTDHYFVDIPGTFVGWVAVLAGVPSGDTKVFPDQGLYAKVNGPDVALTLYGSVVEGDIAASVFSGFNILSVLNPVDGLTLGTTGLFTGDANTGVKASPDGGFSNNPDILYILDPSTGVATQYYFVDIPGTFVGWAGVLSGAPADSVTLDSGSAIYLARNGVPFNWNQTFAY